MVWHATDWRVNHHTLKHYASNRLCLGIVFLVCTRNRH